MGNGNGDLVVKSQDFGNRYWNLNMVLGEGWMIVLCQILNVIGGEISRRCVKETQIPMFDNKRRWKVGAGSNILLLTDCWVGMTLKNRYPRLFSNLVLKEGSIDKYGVWHEN